MSLAEMSLPDLIGVVLGFALTLMVFSYVLGDNALFRTTIHLFIGVAAGYAAVVAWYSVVYPRLITPLINGTQSERLFALFPLIFSGLLLFKISPRLSRLGNPAIAYLVGAGVATIIGGAVMGTVFPLVMASINLLDIGATSQPGTSIAMQVAQAVFILVGTLTTLIYFHFGARQKLGTAPRRPEWLEILALVGQIFIAITLGVIFASVIVASLTALIDRVYFITDLIFALFSAP
jgi:hypothetical protein